MTVPRIALIGMMGVGKTSVASELSRRLQIAEIDLDSEIERRTGYSIPKLFLNIGESGFRQQEQRALEDISASTAGTSVVLATGGGVVTSETCCHILRQNFTVVWLEASPAIIAQRLAVQPLQRPLLEGATNVVERLSTMLSERRKLYQQTASWSVVVDDKDIASVVDEICRKGVWVS